MTNDTLIAEIVTFRAVPGTDDTELTQAAVALEPFLMTRAGFVSRHLSCGADGTWTDHVVWSDLGLAKAASEALMSEPAAGPFMMLIDPASVVMTHAPVMVSQAA